MTVSDLLVEPLGRSARPGRRIAAAVAVGALGAASVAVLMPAPAGAGEVPAPGPVRAEDADGSDVYTSPPTADNPWDGAFGTTKVSVQVLPVEGTYSGTADLSGAQFTLTPTEDFTVPTQSCTTDESGTCYFDFIGGNAVSGHQKYLLTQTSAPTGFFVNPTQVVVGRCLMASYGGRCGPDRAFGGTTDNQFQFENPGTARPVAGSVTSTVYPLDAVPSGPGAPDFASGLIAGATFELRATVDSPALASATSGTDGSFSFPGVFAPGNYVVVQTGAAAGYLPSAPVAVTVPAAATAEASAVPVQVAVENAPNIAAPVLAPDATSVTAGSPAVARDVLANDQLYGADAYILAASAAHGSVSVGNAPGCTLPAGQCQQVVFYFPDSTYTGTDVVTYSVATRGGLSSSTDTITVVPRPRPVAGSVTSTVYPLDAVPTGPGSPPFTSGLIGGAGFELRATVDGPALASATSGADGSFSFPGVFAPGSYYVVQTGAPSGYLRSAPVAVTVPAALTAEASAEPVQVAVENAPNIAAPLLAPDATTLTIGSPVLVRDVLGNDQLYGADAYILAASAVHGSVTVGDAPGCTLPAGQCPQVVRYLADPAYLGTDVVTYSVATRGGLSSSTDTITVVAVPVVTPPTVVPVAAPAVPLAKTGAEHAAGGAVYGAGLLLLGTALTAAGARRRARV